MNIKITKKQAEYFKQGGLFPCKYIIGSYLYKTNRENSDTDYLIYYNSFHKKSDLFYPNYHRFQYDDVENNAQYIFTSHESFWKNLFSGDSTINADVVLFHHDLANEEKLNMCRTYNIIKSFIGFAKRDIKNYKADKGKNKLFHIERGLYCAEKLMNNELPILEEFKTFGNKHISDLEELEHNLRNKCNVMFEKNELTMYPKLPIEEPVNDLERLLIEANNIKEFRY